MSYLSSSSISVCTRLSSICSRRHLAPARSLSRFTSSRPSLLSRNRAQSRHSPACAAYATAQSIRCSTTQSRCSPALRFSARNNMSTHATATAEPATTTDNPLLKVWHKVFYGTIRSLTCDQRYKTEASLNRTDQQSIRRTVSLQPLTRYKQSMWCLVSELCLLS